VEIKRREFLKLLGVSSAATAVGIVGAETLLSVPDDVFERVQYGPRIESWKNSICAMCPGGCGIRVRCIDEIPVRITGNPLYPVNRGAICPKAESAIEMLFHPSRIRNPLKRIGERGENSWEKISWENAVDLLSARLQNLQQLGAPEKLVTVTQNNNHIINDLLQFFMNSVKSPNFISTGDSRSSALAGWLTQGAHEPPVYDLHNTNYVLNFGADLLDEGPSPIRFNQLYSELRNRKDQDKVKIIQFSSFMSRTAANSSEWVATKPGTLSALALAIASVMVRDRSYDKKFIDRDTFGFDTWKDRNGKSHRGFKNVVLEEYYPEKVAQITGVPASKIVSIAREFEQASSAVALAGEQATYSTNSLYSALSVFCLNALKGNINKPGGVLSRKKMNFGPLTAMQYSALAPAQVEKAKIVDQKKAIRIFQTDAVTQLLPALENGEPYGIDTLLFYGINPLFESTGQKKLTEALKKTPFIVSSTSFMDETAVLADLVLPEPVFLERWDGSCNIPTMEFHHFGVQQPVIDPLYDTKHIGDIILEVGKRLGGEIAAQVHWENYKDFLQDYTREIFNSGQGTIISESTDLAWIEFLKQRGWQAHEYSTFDEFWDILIERGGWWDPTVPGQQDNGGLQKKSGKFDFFSRRLKNEIESKRSVDFAGVNSEEMYRAWKIEARGDLAFLPHFEKPRFASENTEYPFHLLIYQTLANNNGIGAPLGLLQELSGLYTREYWHNWVELNPETASRFDIHEDDPVNIISPAGRITAKAKILPTIMPEVVVMPFSRFKNPLEMNPLRIMVSDMDYMIGQPSRISTMVQIEKAKRGEVS
jgi:anaerobic selenocysteine-containing dehydrogenase